MILDARSRNRIEEIEKYSKYKTGLGTIERGECPEGNRESISCAVCNTGHILECHHPLSCKDAFCQHYRRELLIMYDPGVTENDQPVY